MRFEHIVLLIIAFNVVSAVVQRRAKKAREKALRGSGVPPAGPNGAWGEDEDAGGAPASRAPRAEPEVPRQPSLAQDILDQIARDLGLKPNPRPASPAPPPRPARAEPVARGEDPSAARERLERRERELEAESLRARETIREWERLASARTRVSGEAPPPASGARPAPRKPLPAVVAPAGGNGRAAALHDPKRLREAFVLKEILDAPLSRRARR